MGFQLAKVKDLKAMPPDAEVDAWLSPALRSLRRAVKVFDGAVPIARSRQFDVQFAKLGPDRKVFEMPEGKPTLHFSDLFAVLPFQVSERKWVIALYEMTPNYNVEEMKDTPYRLALRPVKGTDCKLTYYDPLADKTLSVKVVERAEDAVTIELPITDTPRLLTLEE
jgi:hypothetical protein